MKRTVIFTFVLSAASFIFNGCRDRNLPVMSEPSLAAVEQDLAIDPLHLEGMLKIKSRTGTSPVEIKYLDPVTWDGVSPIKPGVFYIFNDLEAAISANTSDPQALDILDRLGKCALSEQKTKISVTGLASGGWIASAYADIIPGQGGTYRIQCLTHTENPFGVSGPITHYAAFWVNSTIVAYYTDYFSDQLNHEVDYSLWRTCPVKMSCCAEVFHWSEYKAGWCSGDYECFE